jgi:predicted ATPase
MRMLGRRDTLGAIQMKLAEQKFVTIVGPGGIGKTRLAVEAAESSARRHERLDLDDLHAGHYSRSPWVAWPAYLSRCRNKEKAVRSRLAQDQSVVGMAASSAYSGGLPQLGMGIDEMSEGHE